MASTYTPIATTTVAGGTVTFSSIPSTYTDLRLVFAGYNDAVLMKMRFNGDTTDSNYSCTMLLGDGNTASSARYSVPWLYVYPPTANTQYNVLIDVMNYANTSTYKTWLDRQNSANSSVAANVGLWRNASAINSITLLTSSGSMTGSVTLYGIKAA